MADVFPLETRLITMAVENLKLVDLTEDGSPSVLRPNDLFQLSVDVVFRPSNQALLKCLLEGNQSIKCYFGVESIGPGNEIQLQASAETYSPVFTYTIKTKAMTPKQAGLSVDTVYKFAVGVIFTCDSTTQSLIAGFAEGDLFFVADS